VRIAIGNALNKFRFDHGAGPSKNRRETDACPCVRLK
jgi:hypothetical protein